MFRFTTVSMPNIPKVCNNSFKQSINYLSNYEKIDTLRKIVTNYVTNRETMQLIQYIVPVLLII